MIRLALWTSWRHQYAYKGAGLCSQLLLGSVALCCWPPNSAHSLLGPQTLCFSSCPHLTRTQATAYLHSLPLSAFCPTVGTPASGLPGSSGPLWSSHFRSMEKACMFSHWSSVKCWPVERTVKKSEATAPSTSVMGPGCGRKDRAGEEPGGLMKHSGVQKPCTGGCELYHGPGTCISCPLWLQPCRKHPHS